MKKTNILFIATLLAASLASHAGLKNMSFDGPERIIKRPPFNEDGPGGEKRKKPAPYNGDGPSGPRPGSSGGGK